VRTLEALLVVVGMLTILRLAVSLVLHPSRFLSRLLAVKDAVERLTMLSHNSPTRVAPSPLPPPLPERKPFVHRFPREGTPGVIERVQPPAERQLAKLVVGAGTRGGFRGNNEDGYLVQERLLAVADGAGGAAGGYASKLALRTIAAAKLEGASDRMAALELACTEANRALHDQGTGDPRLTGMATTLDVVLFSRGLVDGPLIVAHIGNGTIFLQLDGKKPTSMTRPHAASQGPLLRAVGLSRNLSADLAVHEAPRIGDRILVATDGLTDCISREALEERMLELRVASPQATADSLLALAAEAGSEDDITVLVADLTGAELISSTEQRTRV